jgi:lysophospholipase L1-like esterase
MQNSETKPGPFESMVVLGESTVEGGGWLASTEERYADILHRLIENAQEQPLRYHNAGVGASVIAPSSPGYDASAKPSAAERLDDAVIAHRPDLVVIAYGLNDMRCAMPLVAFRTELEDLIRRIRAKLSPMIVLVSVYHMPTFQYYPPFDKGSLQATIDYNEIIRDVADGGGCVYADVWSAEGMCDHVVHPDTVHANKIGNMLIAHKIFEAIAHAAPGIAKNVMARDARTQWTRDCSAVQQSTTEPVHDD